MARAVADWWDAIELWLTSLAFPVQVVLAALVGVFAAIWPARRASRLDILEAIAND